MVYFRPAHRPALVKSPRTECIMCCSVSWANGGDGSYPMRNNDWDLGLTHRKDIKYMKWHCEPRKCVYNCIHIYIYTYMFLYIYIHTYIHIHIHIHICISLYIYICVYIYIYGCFHKWGIPQNGWFIRDNPHLKWMMTGGTPTSGNRRIMYNLPIPQSIKCQITIFSHSYPYYHWFVPQVMSTKSLLVHWEMSEKIHGLMDI